MSMTITAYVARGKSISTGQPGKFEFHGPGTKVELPAAEALRLISLGFVQDTPPDLAPPTAPNPAHIGPAGPVNVQGPVYRR
jgi:hypothetical protein